MLCLDERIFASGKGKWIYMKANFLKKEGRELKKTEFLKESLEKHGNFGKESLEKEKKTEIP